MEGDEDPSPIGNALAESVDSPLRIAEPAVRRSWLEHGPAASTERRGAEPFVAVSWDEAERLVAAEIERVRRTHGNASIFAGSYGWGSAGQFHHAQGHLYRLLNLVGGFTRSVNTYSLAAAENIMPHVMGPFPWLQGQHTSWPSIIGHTELMVCFGGMPLKNSQINYRGVARHTQRGYMREAREAGIAFVNVGPLRDDVADFLDAEWLPARPNTDVAIMLGLAHTLLEEGRHDEDFLSRYCVGFERFAAYLRGESDGRPKDVAWAAELSGLDAETLRGLARRMADSRTMINMSWSLNRQDHGEQPFWTGAALAAMLGQVGLPGGGVAFGYAATSNMGLHSHRMRWAGLNPGPFPVDDLIPVSRIADMLLNPGAAFDFNGRRLRFPDVRLLYWLGGNPFHHHQDLNRLLRAWRRPETVVVHEPWWTPLARHADIALPATTPLERNDFVTSPSDPRVLAVQRCIAPYAESRNDFDILAGIAERLGCAQGFTEGRSEMDWLRHLHDQNRQRAAEQGFTLPDFDTFWREGECGLPEREDVQVMHAKFRADPEGNAPAHPLRAHRDLLGDHRGLRVRRLPRAPGLDRARGVAGVPARGALPPAPRLQPARDAPAQPVRRERAEPRRQGERARGHSPQPRRRASARHRGGRRGARVQRPRAVPRRSGAERRGASRRGADGDRRVVRPGAAGRDRKPLQARQRERAHSRQGHLAPRPGLLRPHLPGGGGALRGRAPCGHRLRSADHRAPVALPLPGGRLV